MKSYKELKKIPINIWDDYHDDGYVPEGERQETAIYLEGEIYSDESKKEILDWLCKKLQGLKDYKEVEFSVGIHESGFPRINIINLTHEKREQLLKELKKANLSFEGFDFDFYSES